MFLIWAAAGALVAAALATTYYVDGARGRDTRDGASPGSAWRTLEKANQSLVHGDVCLVRAGVYQDSQICPVRSGTAQAPIVFAAYPGEEPEITGGHAGSIVLLDDTRHITVRGFGIHSPTEHEWVVQISGESAQHNRIEACDISDPEGYAPLVIANGASHNVVTGCTIHDTGGAYQGSGDCIVLNFGAHHNTITGNKCYNACHSQILVLNDCAHNTISQNELYATDPAWAGAGVNLCLRSSSNIVADNRIHDLGYIIDDKCAIQVNTADNVIRNNVVWSFGGFGVALLSYPYEGERQESVGNLVANNTVFHCGRQGLWVQSKGDCVSRRNRVVNNIVVGSPLPWDGHNAWLMLFDTYHAVEPIEPGSWLENVFCNNVFFHAQAGEPDMVLHRRKGPAVAWSIPELEAAYPDTFSVNLEAEPEFVDPENADFALRSSSPAIDAGLDIGSPFHGASPDIGAVETTLDEN
jgi:parallel beta-helix repeat protein